MGLEVGDILTGKVTSITKFGAFVTVSSGESGLVHISEIAHTYVQNVSDYLAVGQEVSVKVINSETGKLNLSIKAVTPPPARQNRVPFGGGTPERQNRVPFGGGTPPRDGLPARRPRQEAAPDAAQSGQSFEDRLKRFMQDSDSKISDSKRHADKKGSRRRRG
ncbi:MAG: S1 RNA-binding domain-containing protein [Oscillospiraceae bacterium]|jgi:S1 RNA binding domain protein|nr:S1 RNA-binding domain-containing protein [Oscillospiraceae bacterium]